MISWVNLIQWTFILVCTNILIYILTIFLAINVLLIRVLHKWNKRRPIAIVVLLNLWKRRFTYSILATMESLEHSGLIYWFLYFIKTRLKWINVRSSCVHSCFNVFFLYVLLRWTFIKFLLCFLKESQVLIRIIIWIKCWAYQTFITIWHFFWIFNLKRLI
jgi:hypothetical protein